MLQLIYCLLLLIPLVALPVGIFFVSKPLGIVLGLVGLLLAAPLAIAAFAHFDLLRMKSRYRLTEDEVAEFSRLVPQLARSPELAGLGPREMRRRAKDAAAEIVRGRRSG